ncbi:MAG: hypothetical protein AAGE80_05560 [Pseudomonadota bacterium]
MDGTQAAIGHNTPDGVSKEVFLGHVRSIAREKAAVKEAQAKLNRARQSAKADNILLKDLDLCVALAELSTPEQIEKLNTQRTYMEYLNAPLGTQMTLFSPSSDDDLSDEERIEQIKKDADAKGYFEGVKGVLFEDGNPHEANSPAGQAWIGGYRRGQEEAAKKIAEKPPAA